MRAAARVKRLERAARSAPCRLCRGAVRLVPVSPPPVKHIRDIDRDTSPRPGDHCRCGRKLVYRMRIPPHGYECAREA